MQETKVTEGFKFSNVLSGQGYTPKSCKGWVLLNLPSVSYSFRFFLLQQKNV